MSKVKLPSRLVVSRIALFTVIGSFLLIFTAAGTSAAGFSFMNSVKGFLGFAGAPTTTVKTASKQSSALTSQTAGDKDSGPNKNPNASGKKDDVDQDAPRGMYRGVTTAERFDISPPLSEMRGSPVIADERERDEWEGRPSGLEGPLGIQDLDQTVQSVTSPFGQADIPAPITSFDSTIGCGGCAPPDPVGDVGPNHYVAMGNLQYQIFNKAGASLLGPANTNTIWAGFGGPCQTENRGDPIVIYDQFDDRWILTQFTAAGPTYFNCVAISTTPNPTGSYFRYAFSTGANFPDYPKYGMWRDALYISTREFLGTAGAFQGVGAYAVNRAQLVAGNPAAQVISFLVPPGGTAYNVGDGLLPTDVDGSTLPPAGAPNYFIGSMDNGGPYGAPQDALTLWKFTANFVTPASSTFLLANTIPIAPYDTQPAYCAGRACIDQPGTANKIDHLGYRQRPTHRAAYRNFGTHESIVTNQSVEASPTMSGIRWWEIRSPNAGPVLFQDATYAPGTSDGIHRWMGSIAMDNDGNMALGYSASSAAVFPSVRYTGRLAGDPLNTMPQGEAAIIAGTGSQTGAQRWGDYTSMNIDSTDDCTFWYVNEYVPVTSSSGWRLRIGSFKFPTCSAATPTATNTPTNTPTNTATATSTVSATPTATAACTPVTFTNTAAITINDNLPASPYPSNIVVSGLTGNVYKVTVKLNGMSHTFPGDIDIMLVGPGGQNALIMSDAGGTNDLVGVDLTLDNDAATPLPALSPIPSGTYQPTNYDTATDVFPAPAPAVSGSSLLTFNGTNPNGTWSLYVRDDAGVDIGSIAGGWEINIITNNCCSWTASTVYPVPILDQASATVDGNLYVFGGVSNGAIVATSNKFDGTTWTAIAPLPVALEFPTAVTDGTNIYILGGANSGGTPQTTLYRYNVALDTYTTLAPFTTGTWNAAAVYLNGNIYKFTGTGPSTASTNVLEIYNVAANTWSTGAVYPLSISFVSAFAHGSFIFAAGGIQSVGSVASLKTYRYDPVANTWDDAAMADLPATRWGAASGLYNGGGVMAGGYVGGTATANISNTAISWDPGTNTWSSLPNMLGERARMTGSWLGGSFYAIGGRSVASSGFVGTTDNQKLTCPPCGGARPELLYYRFNGSGTSVPNEALAPPSGTTTATILGGVTQGGSGQFGGGLIGSGISSTTDYLDTGWATNLTGTSWTISLYLNNIGPSATLYYFFGDASAGIFRAFTNGVAGPNNIILRGTGITDIIATGAVQTTPTVTHFVYDSALGNIKAYVNGVLVSTVAQAGTPTINGTAFKVMGYSANVGSPAGGIMDEFRLYSRALDAAEVAATWNATFDSCATISGTITYGNAIGNPVPPRFVKNVSVASTVGSPMVGPVITGTPGTYLLTGFGSGSYTIKPTKPGGANGAITSNDAARVAQGVTGSLPFVSNNQRFAADVSGNGVISSTDAAKIAQFAAGLPFSSPNFSGEWRFFTSNLPAFPAGAHPQDRTYASVTSSVTGEDYIGLLIGDTSGNWNPATHPRGAVFRGQMSDVSEDGGAVEMPITVAVQDVVAAADKDIVVPVSVQGVVGKDIISYEFDLRYDPAVMQPLIDSVDVVGTISRGLSVVVNPNEPGLLRVVVYGAMPITEDGLLLNLRFTAVGHVGSISSLTFERMMFNEGDAGVVVTDGRVALSEN